MNKFYKTLLSGTLMATLALPSVAQQLPNAGFENDWVDCKPWDTNKTQTTKGKTPTPWCISHVGGTLSDNELGEPVDGNNSSKAIKIFNKAISIQFLGINQKVPGYFTLGTTWSTSKGSRTITNKDGGTFGGLDFSYRPDAIGFSYLRSGANSASTVIVYSWKGYKEQEDVPGNIVISGSTTTTTMKNRERNILDIETPEGKAITTSPDFELISNFIDKETIKGSTANDTWNEYFHELEYKSSSTPEMFNIIVSVSDYFDQSSIVSDEYLIVDDVKLYYYSRLKSIAFNGGEVLTDLEEGQVYDIEGEYNADAVEAQLLGQTAEVSYSYNADEKVLTATVSNVDADRDGKTSHVYTFKFGAAETPAIKGDPYTAFLNVWLNPEKTDDMHIGINKTSEVLIDHADDGTCTFALKDFSIIGMNVGDVVVPNTIYTTDGEGNKTYSGSVEGLSLEALGDMTLNVTVDGTIKADGKIDVNINVVVPGVFDSIPVTFTSEPWSVQYLDGYLNGSMMGMPLFTNDTKTVMIYPALAADGQSVSSVFALNDFEFFEANMGNIVVENTLTEQDGKTVYTGHNPELSLAGGDIKADVTLNGEITERGAAKMIIDVVWNGIAIPVTFTTHPIYTATLFDEEANVEKIMVGIDDLYQLNHKLDSSDSKVTYTFDTDEVIEITANHLIKPLNLGTVKVTASVNTPTAARAAAKSHTFDVLVVNGDNGSTTGVENVVAVPASQAATEIYDLRGVRVDGANLAPGLYIRRSAGKTEKFIVK